MELLSKQQVGQLLGIRPRTVDSWEARGWLPPSVRVGGGKKNNLTGLRGRKRWHASEIEAFLESRRKD